MVQILVIHKEALCLNERISPDYPESLSPPLFWQVEEEDQTGFLGAPKRILTHFEMFTLGNLFPDSGGSRQVKHNSLILYFVRCHSV